MMSVFNFFGSILGYLLWGFYILVKNYGVAIILFTVVLKILMFPFSLKQQKSMASSSKLAAKQKELQAKYGSDKVALQRETAALYEKEGVNPAGGCLPMLIPFPILLGLYYTIINPLSNAIHLGGEAVAQAVAMLQQIPGISSTFQGYYGELNIVQNFAALRPYLTMFTGEELDKIQTFSQSFNFLGLDLLGTPASGSGIFEMLGNMFHSNLWLIPVLCLASSYAAQIISMKMQPGMNQQQGCMTAMLYVMPLFTAYIALTVPAAVGFYWIISTLTMLVQTVVMNMFYSPAHLVARSEAQRVALLELEEAKLQPLPAAEQKKLAEKYLLNKKLPEPAKSNANQSAQQPKKPTPAKGKNPGNASDYLGKK